MITRLLQLLAFSLFSNLALAAGGGVVVDHVDIDLEDKVSLQRGAALFTNYCMGCHSMKYARYERVATDLGIPPDLYMENLVFADAKIGELMQIALSPEQASSWFGAPPPDLTLEARLRGPDWLYSYMRAFYKDDSRPYGVNNTIFPDVGMPHVLEGLQGLCADKPGFGVKKQFDTLTGELVGGSGCQEYAQKGSLSASEYDRAIKDLVGFMVYMGEPSKLESHRIGRNVLLFLAFLFIFVYFLNKEYWRGIH
ncbi:MAG: cytochrome c1 [Gammaproteobacteria bacterium]|nr:MAG: cytochrome c1 [Pseudomonadota bacterium]PIE38522.1 MAG: cytochrome c1 [Gammaproteobacteria bacterium]